MTAPCSDSSFVVPVSNDHVGNHTRVRVRCPSASLSRQASTATTFAFSRRGVLGISASRAGKRISW
jgi:hypothetical protein